jgi:hypothetical protein
MKSRIIIALASLMLLGATLAHAAGDDMQKQIDAIMGALPKFAIPMREVGDRFQNMYYAAEGGNWGLAFYMSKYMNGALNPAKVTKPAEYSEWTNFYSKTFDLVNKAIMAQDFKKFEKEYMAVIKSCNECHTAMGYDFIKVNSKATDVPK